MPLGVALLEECRKGEMLGVAWVELFVQYEIASFFKPCVVGDAWGVAPFSSGELCGVVWREACLAGEL